MSLADQLYNVVPSEGETPASSADIMSALNLSWHNFSEARNTLIKMSQRGYLTKQKKKFRGGKWDFYYNKISSNPRPLDDP